MGGLFIGNRKVIQYVYQRGTTYYFVRRVPKDIQRHYKSSRVVICLKTSRRDRVVRAGMSIAQRLEDYWLLLRLANLDIPGLHLLRDRPLPTTFNSSQTLHDALELYLRLKGVGKGKVFRRGAERNIQTVIDVLGDRPVDAYSFSDAASLRDYLLGKGLTTNSVKRNFSTIRSIINLHIQEHGLDCQNAFSCVYLPDLKDNKRRKPIPLENIKRIQRDCRVEDDEARWLVALIADTGMRLSEAAGLHIDDIVLEDDTPLHQPHTAPLAVFKDKGQPKANTVGWLGPLGCQAHQGGQWCLPLRLSSIQQVGHHKCQLSLSRHQQAAQAKGSGGMCHPLIQTLARRPPEGRGGPF